MKNQLQALLDSALQQLQQQQVIPIDWVNKSTLERTRDNSHGDWASNLAMVAAKAAGLKPRDLAQKIVDALPHNTIISKIEIAGPGFINFYLPAQAEFAVLNTILEQQHQFGRSQYGQQQKIQVEFVSANPTSSLHVGHGRGAAYGMTVANLLEAIGYQVEREYYVNDAGRQMAILATSTFLRYLQLNGAEFKFPSNGYKGDYIFDIAKTVISAHGTQWQHDINAIFMDVPADEVKNDAGEVISGDKEAHIDGLIDNSRRVLGAEGYNVFFRAALDSILDDIKDDLAGFGVSYDQWFSEKTLADDGSIDKVVKRLQDNGFIYEKGGALWFKSTDFGDEKDRVVVRDNGQATYFASDIAYHLNKYERGLDKIVNIWGADHHGYITRVKAAITALGLDANKLDVLLVQFVTLWRGSEQVQMSSRSGQFITLRELRDEVGNDAARFYYITRKSEQHIDFDLDLAKSQSKDNPVYYIQYAHARICRVFDKLQEKGLRFSIAEGQEALSALSLEVERDLVKKLAAYPEVLQQAAVAYEPHHVSNYLKDLASQFHGWYNDHMVLHDDAQIRQARLFLSLAVKQVLANGLQLLGVSAPEKM
ncbi:arginine--tRNA ligase [Agitococcus lubricus]|uniref:Arginine--tRNA ligase n=1 Tax=Agitococcus lubricus TaxID=1077255 RepID=A0A2T5IWB2_9GAMM|nr:arginine--tRNA ligase [Agitococcus lubricus]PTQ88204.1 arginyl-tRNA synthetase [Agitococcus lubricus]